MITGMPRIAIAVRNLDEAIKTFRDTFGMPVNEAPASAQTLGVRIAMCTPPGGSNIELMSPADSAKPLNQSLQKFLDRRGEGLFALMLEAPDPNAEAEELSARGLHVLPLMPGAGGRDVHPRSTHGVLIRVYPTRPPNSQPSIAEGAAVDGSPGDRPAALSGIVRVLIAVNDCDDAVRVFHDRFRMQVELCPPDEARGVQAALCTPGTGGRIELLSPLDPRRSLGRASAQFLEQRGEGMFALVLESAALDATVSALRAKGLPVQPAGDGAEAVSIDPSATYGTRFYLQDRRA